MLPIWLRCRHQLFFLVETIVVWANMDGSVYGMATALMAWKVPRSDYWSAMTPELVAQVFSHSMRSGTVSLFSIDRATWSDYNDRTFSWHNLRSFLFLICESNLRGLPRDLRWQNICIVLIEYTCFLPFLKSPVSTNAPLSPQTIDRILRLFQQALGALPIST